jgi:hypothetical protein
MSTTVVLAEKASECLLSEGWPGPSDLRGADSARPSFPRRSFSAPRGHCLPVCDPHVFFCVGSFANGACCTRHWYTIQPSHNIERTAATYHPAPAVLRASFRREEEEGRRAESDGPNRAEGECEFGRKLPSCVASKRCRFAFLSDLQRTGVKAVRIFVTLSCCSLCACCNKTSCCDAGRDGRKCHEGRLRSGAQARLGVP